MMKENIVINKTTINYYIQELRQSIHELKEDVGNCTNLISKNTLRHKLYEYEDTLYVYISQAIYWGVYKDE